jgi:hypothetical protein
VHQLSAEQKLEARTRRCFWDDDNIPGFKRFFSVDARFPISVAFPREDGFFDFNDDGDLHLQFGGNPIVMAITRLNLSVLAQRGGPFGNLSELVLEGRRTMLWFQQQGMELRKNAPAEFRTLLNVRDYTLKKRSWNMATVGSGETRFKAPRLLFHNRQGIEGEWVFFTQRPEDLFARRPSEFVLWTIIRNAVFDYAIDSATWHKILSSWRWLNPDFATSIMRQ